MLKCPPSAIEGCGLNFCALGITPLFGPFSNHYSGFFSKGMLLCFVSSIIVCRNVGLTLAILSQFRSYSFLEVMGLWCCVFSSQTAVNFV
jgi:hypothetical protein